METIQPVLQTASELLDRWTARKNEYARVHATVDAAKLLAEVLSDIEQVVALQANAVLTLETAAARSGYSKDHLARLIREGKIPNAGRRGAPRIRTVDLPARGQDTSLPVAVRGRALYDALTDARVHPR
jgi:hypothetical protein